MGFSAAHQDSDLSDAILDAAGSVIFAIDREGKVIRWNQAAAELTGISADRIQGQIFHQTVLCPGEETKWEREFGHLLSGYSTRFFEILWKTHDDSFVLVTCRCSSVRDAEGNVQYIVGTALDSVARELVDDRMAEFRDISRFLHSTVAQNLVALSFTVSQLESAVPDAPLRAEIESALRLIDRCCSDVRLVSSLLTPPSLSGTTLEGLIGQHAAFVREETGLRILLDLDPAPESLSSEAQLLMITAVQSWVGKGVWSRTKPEISFRLRSSRSGGVVLEMEMVPPTLIVSVRGWSIIRERARALGGEFSMAGDVSRIIATMRFPGRAG